MISHNTPVIPDQLKFEIKMRFFHIFSCVMSIILLLISNQFNIFLYGVPLFTAFSIPLCFILGLMIGWGYVECVKYEYRNRDNNKFEKSSLKASLKHLIQMHVLSFLALNVFKIFSICYFYPATFLGISMLSAMFVIYNRFVKENMQDVKELEMNFQFLMAIFVAFLGFCFGALCANVFNIIIGFDLTIVTLSIWCGVIWLSLNSFGMEFLSYNQQFYLSCFVFCIATLTLCMCQIPMLSCLLYLTPALNYYPLATWLSDEVLPKNENPALANAFNSKNVNRKYSNNGIGLDSDLEKATPCKKLNFDGGDD